jgi:hypothetical protein
LPDFLRFPSVTELVTQQLEDAQRTPSIRSSGLFQGLLLSRPEPLYSDALEHPDKYDERILPLTRELVSTRREPTPEERQLLDAAMLDFSRSQPAASAVPAPPKMPPSLKRQTARMPSEGEETDVVDVNPAQEAPTIPQGQVRAFWWL